MDDYLDDLRRAFHVQDGIVDRAHESVGETDDWVRIHAASAPSATTALIDALRACS